MHSQFRQWCAVSVICLLGAVIGCNKPAGGEKGTKMNGSQPPANTTDSK